MMCKRTASVVVSRSLLVIVTLSISGLACNAGGHLDDLEVGTSAPLSGISGRTQPLLSDAQKIDLIDSFEHKIMERWNIKIDPADYDVHVVESGTYIVHRENARLDGADSQTRRRFELESVVTIPAVAPPSSESNTPSTALALEPAWQEPRCRSYVDPDGVGEMFGCLEVGFMDYAGATRANWAVRMRAMCSPKPWGTLPRPAELDACDAIVANIDGPVPGVVSNGFDPMSTKTLSDCADVPIGVSFAGFSVGTTLKLCEKLIPLPLLESPEYMRAVWKGNAWTPNDKRETGFVNMFGVPYGVTIAMGFYIGYQWSTCDVPGPWVPPFDLCGPL